MALFLSSVTNRVDKKGRVSVPATFRAALKADGYGNFIAFPSFNHRGIECWTVDRIEQISKSLDELNPFGEDHETFSSILADAHDIGIDIDGRITLPEDLIAHAGITDGVMFVGQGGTFFIWEPTAFQEYRAGQRERARANRENFNWRPQAPQAAP